MKDIKKRAVTILLHNEDGDILAVSRKDNQTDFGLPGGKVDEGETDEQAVIREVEEETGLKLYAVKPYFVREDGEYVCTTFIGNYKGEIQTTEKGKVIWTDFKTIQKGSFGKYNVQLENFFNLTHKYEEGDIIINADTSEGFKIILEMDAGINVSGYFVSAFCSNIGYAFVKKTALDNVRMHRMTDHELDFDENIKNLDAKSPQFFACASHFDVNQYYGKTFLYSYHLKRTVDVGRRFKSEIPEIDWPHVEAGLWNHDNVEDARNTYNDLVKAIGEKGAGISFALTNSDGKTREERANSKYYAKIREIEYAIFAKLCDRIANVEFSLKTKSSMFLKYKQENEHFKKELHINGLYEVMWKHLDDLFNS